MELYQLSVPTRIYFGRDIWREGLRRISPLLKGSVLVVTTGRSLVRLGYVEALERALKEFPAVTRVTVFQNVSANPRLSEVQAAELGRRAGAELVLGFGGGSAIDAAKAAALELGSGDAIKDVFDGKKAVGDRALPVIAMPTTAGTGSELSKAAILSDEVQGIKKGIRGEALYPAAAIVDSRFTDSVPLRTTMETGFDVLAHAVESDLSRAASMYTRMQSECAIQIVGTCLPRLAARPEDTEARDRLSFASMIMGINLGNASTCLPHRLQYPVGVLTGTSHGAGLAALFSAWAGLEYQAVPERVARCAALLSGALPKDGAACAEVFRRFIVSLGLPASLQELGVERARLPELAARVTGNIQNDPAAQDHDIILKLYEAAWQGEL